MAETKSNSGLLKSTTVWTAGVVGGGIGRKASLLFKVVIQQMYQAFPSCLPGTILGAGNSVMEGAEEMEIFALRKLSFPKLRYVASPSWENSPCPVRTSGVSAGRESLPLSAPVLSTAKG